MKLIPYVRFLFVIVLIYNLLSSRPEEMPTLVIIFYAMLEFVFLLFQVLEGIKEFFGKVHQANMLRLYAVIYNLLTLAGYSVLMLLIKTMESIGILFIFMLMASTFILIVDVKTYFAELTAR